MENIFLKQLATKQIDGGANQQDLNSPFSFIEWKQRRPTYIEEDVVYHYNQYVVDWFNKNKNKPISQKFLLRQKYLYLLSQLQLFFSEEEKNDWYNRVNIADEKELLLAIPYFAKKLKAISLYYLKLRKKLKNVKLKYNLVGTETAVEQEIQNRLLEVFSDLNTELPPEIANNLPTLDSLRDNLTVKIEQLYDDSVYFDRDPTLALSAYYDPFHEVTAQFFATKGLTLSSDNWAFNSLSVPITSDLEAFVSQLTGNVFELSDGILYANFVEKFLREDIYLTTFDALSAVVSVYDISISRGSNGFYYPYGTSFSQITGGQITPVPLSSFPFNNATASEVISGADIIEVKVGEQTKSAWLKKVNHVKDVKQIKAKLREKKTSFIFPFPGYGLSADDVPWTGPSLSSTPEHSFLPKQTKTVVNSTYWSQVLPRDTLKPIFLNTTDLVKSGAYAGTNPAFADKIYVKHRTDGTSTSLSSIGAAWLYKPLKTSIPVATTTAISALFWPTTYVNPDASEIPAHLKQELLKNTTAPISVADLDVPFAVASDNFETAEKIYKVQKPNSMLLSALECCWLYGPTLSSDNYVWNAQGGFSLIAYSGEITKFIWGGTDNTPISSVFVATSHSQSCPFSTSEQTDPTACTCKQVYYSPYGHNGDSFLDFNGHADYIVEDTDNTIDPFVLGVWRDSLSGTFESSAQFVWYAADKPHSWGNGQWITTNGEAPFTLKKGKTYFYKRTTTGAYPNYPPYVVNYRYADNNTTWIEAKRSPNNTWSSTGRPSTLKISDGDLIKWDKQENSTFSLLTAALFENSPENTGNIWSGLDVLPLSSASGTSIISWPPLPREAWSECDSQYPRLSGIPVTIGDVSRIYWWKITRLPSADQYIRCSRTLPWTTFMSFPHTVPVTLSWPSPSSVDLLSDTQYPTDLDTGAPIASADVAKIHWWKLTVDYSDSAPPYSYYEYENTFKPYLVGTYSVEVSATLKSGKEYHFTEIPQFCVAPLETYTVFDQRTVTFAPYLTGTYYVEVSAHARVYLSDIPKPSERIKTISDVNVSSLSSSVTPFGLLSSINNATDRIVVEDGMYFSCIPILSVIPPYRQENITIEFKQPASGYIISQPLSGWNFVTNSYDKTSSQGGKPYWVPLNSSPNYVEDDFGARGVSGGGISEPRSTLPITKGPTYIDGYLPNVLQSPSPLAINYGDVVEYERQGPPFTWDQPLDYQVYNPENQWTAITPSASGESPISDIVLSNIIDGKPVQIIYEAKSDFTWQVFVETPGSSTFSTEVYFDASNPYNVLSNKFFPTVASIPVAEKLYTEEDSGGFFTQGKLGASQYINDNFTAELTGEYFESSFLTEDSSKHIGGRGLTKKDQDTLYTWSENNQWMKEPPTSNQLAGAVKKSLTKTLQTFVPYQNNSEQKEFGLVTPTSRVSPWGGEKGDQWTDLLNEPKSFTGVRNVSAWGETQVLKQNQKVMDNWVTDIFGNQYGLFKSIDVDEKSIYNRSNITGQLWVKTNDQLVNPAYASLSAVFEPFKTINQTIYKQLTGEGIVNVDCFFDTLMIETPSVVIYSKLRYDYEEAKIEGILDNTRFKYLTKTNPLSVSFGQTWFFETEKLVHNLYISVSSEKLLPEIFELDLTNNTFGRKFPFNNYEQTMLSRALSGLSVKTTDRGLLTHNKLLKQSLITIVGRQTDNEPFIVEIITDDREDQRIHSVTIYTDNKYRPIPFSTQVSVLSNYFYESIPLTFEPTDTIQIYNRDYTTLSISAINDPTYFELVNFTSNVTALSDGTFIAYFENPGLYHVNYKVGNDAGFNLGCLTLSAIGREDVLLLNNSDFGFLVLNGYNGRYVI